MAPLSRCAICKLPIKVNKEVRCSTCGETIHASCTATDDSSLDPRSSTTMVCLQCTAPAGGSNNTGKGTTLKPDNILNITHFEAIMEKLNSLSVAIATCNSNVEEMNAQVLHNTSDITDLKSENIALYKKVAELETSIQNINIDSNMCEIRERIKREANIIIYGLPNKNSAEQDLFDTNAIIKQILPDQIIKVNRGFRLGKLSENSRPLKILLENSTDVLTILRNKHKLSKDLFPDISIKQDLTPFQQMQLRNLRASLEDRKKNGEVDITIKYVKGIAKIVSTNNKSNKRSREEDTPPKPDKGIKINKSLPDPS